MLTIGDGLVTVIPALMISISGGLIVTRASSDERLGADFSKQLFGNPQPLLLASGRCWSLGCFPGLAQDSFPAAGRRRSARRLEHAQKKQAAGAEGETAAKPAAAKDNIEVAAARGAAGHRNRAWAW